MIKWKKAMCVNLRLQNMLAEKQMFRKCEWDVQTYVLLLLAMVKNFQSWFTLSMFLVKNSGQSWIKFSQSNIYIIKEVQTVFNCIFKSMAWNSHNKLIFSGKWILLMSIVLLLQYLYFVI